MVLPNSGSHANIDIFLQLREHRSPLVKGDAHRVEGLNVLRESVTNRLFFGNEGAKYAVPNDEHAGVVLVDVLRVASVMDAVMRGGIEDFLEGAE